MPSGKIVRTLRFDGEYIYGQTARSDTAFASTMEVKREGNKYVGQVNVALVLASSGKRCSVTYPYELTVVTPDRIEGRTKRFGTNFTFDWNTCAFSTPLEDWEAFTWVPVR